MDGQNGIRAVYSTRARPLGPNGNHSVHWRSATSKASRKDLSVAATVKDMTTRSILYDRDGKPTEDQSLAVRGVVVELDDRGGIVATYPGLSWKVDPISLDGDAGELATRPTRPSPRPRRA